MAKEFKLVIECSNEAFSDNPSYEVVRILRAVVKRIDEGNTAGILRDVNGNRVGTFEYVDRKENL